MFNAPYPDAFVPALTAPKRALKSRAAFSLPSPMWSAPGHNPGSDAVFALAVKYRIIDYVRFVGTLRRTGYSGDIVLAVSPDMETQCKECRKYLQAMDVIAYPVVFNCTKVREGIAQVAFGNAYLALLAGWVFSLAFGGPGGAQPNAEPCDGEGN